MVARPPVDEIIQILNIVQSIAGGTYWQTFGPGNVQVTNAVTLGVSVFDPGGGIIPQADITPGTYTIDRIRLGVLTPAIVAGASSKTDGAVYKSYAFPVGDGWAIGDLFVATFTGIQVTISGITTSFPPIQVWGRVVMEPDIDSVVNTINTNQGNPAADTLASTTAKLGNLARTLKLLLGTRWDVGGDLGTDIAALLGAEMPLSGTVVDAGPAVTGFKTSLVGGNNQYNGGLMLFSPGAANAGQSHLIDTFTAVNGVVTFALNDQWTTVPVNGDAFVVIPNAGVYLKKIFAAVNSIGGDPWTTALPDAYGAGSAGKILGTNLDALVSSRLAAAAYTAERGTDNAMLAANGATAAELLKVPKSDSNVTWNATALAAIQAADAAALAAVAYTRQAGVMQVKATTIDLDQAANTYVLVTAMTQDVIVESMVIRMSGGAIGGAFTYLTVQTDDATPIVLINNADGAVGNLANEAQLAWTGAILLDAGTLATIGLTIAVAQGGAEPARVCDVVFTCRAVVAGGYLT